MSELEEALMSIVGGVDIHQKQLTYDYVEPETGRWERGRIVPADRQHLAGVLALDLAQSRAEKERQERDRKDD